MLGAQERMKHGTEEKFQRNLFNMFLEWPDFQNVKRVKRLAGDRIWVPSKTLKVIAKKGNEVHFGGIP